MPKRDRGWFLTDKGLNKLRTAIDERYPDEKPSFAVISEQTDPKSKSNSQAGRFVSRDVISNIHNKRAKADWNSIKALFNAFGLTVEDDDLTRDAPYTPTPSAEPIFVGREADLTELDRRVKAGEKAIQIVAAGGIGKSRFVHEYLKRFNPDVLLRFDIAREVKDVASPSSTIDEWLKQQLGEEPGRDFRVSLHRLRQALQAAKSKVFVFIDNLETALDNGKFVEPYRSEYVALFGVLIDPQVNSVTLITSRERLRETVTVEWYTLKGLDLEAWQQFFQNRQIVDSSCLEEMRKAYGGNAKAMELFCGEVKADYDGDLKAYWQEFREYLLQVPELGDLVRDQLDRLQKTNPDAYDLLCRLGCYRYQDVPLIPKDGVLCLLWNVPDKHRKLNILGALKDRNLVDVYREKYLLHPAIREAAIERLRENKEDWEKANRQAAEFWTESVKTVVTVDDANRAFEAYYHYVQIEDFDSASQVIIQMRANKWAEPETLGGSFLRLGLMDTIALSIQFIVEKLSPGYNLSRLYNVLGNIYCSKGSLSLSISFHEKSIEISEISLQNYCYKKEEILDENLWLSRLTIYGLANIISCKIYAFELKEALCLMNKLKDVIAKIDEACKHKSFAKVYTISCLDLSRLSFLSSSIGKTNEAWELANKAYEQLTISGRSKNTSNIKEDALLFLGLAYKKLGDIENSFKMYNQAIEYAQQSNYTQVQGKAVTGLGELHRIQGDFAKAIPLHQESIELLDKICAKCDLAEAYFQCALTYQAMGETDDSQQNFNAALKLFEEIKAPKQIERVRQAMNPV